MTIESNTIYYFLSTYAQCLAALVGLSATFAVLSYQSQRNNHFEKSKKIASVFRSKYSFLFSKSDKTIFRDFTSDEKRCRWLKSWTTNFFENEGKLFKEKVSENGIIDASENLAVEFLGWSEEFEELSNLERELTSFVRNIRYSLGVGLISIGISLSMLPFTEFLYSRTDICLFLFSFFGGLGLFYGKFIYKSLRSTFRLPVEF
jgi:hypothetical protein